MIILPWRIWASRHARNWLPSDLKHWVRPAESVGSILRISRSCWCDWGVEFHSIVRFLHHLPMQLPLCHISLKNQCRGKSFIVVYGQILMYAPFRSDRIMIPSYQRIRWSRNARVFVITWNQFCRRQNPKNLPASDSVYAVPFYSSNRSEKTSQEFQFKPHSHQERQR